MIDLKIHCDESLEVMKSLPDFPAKQNKHVSWRESVNNAMSVLGDSRKYFDALKILKNKITMRIMYYQITEQF